MQQPTDVHTGEEKDHATAEPGGEPWWPVLAGAVACVVATAAALVAVLL